MIKDFVKKFKPFLKYCVVGVLGTLLDLAALFVFVEYVGIAVIPATTLSFLLAVTNNFILNKTWTFKSKSKNYRKLYIKFLIISVIGLGLTLLCMYVLVNMLGTWYMLAKAVTSLIVLTWNFLGNKLWTFKLNKNLPDTHTEYEFKFSIIIPAYNEENRIKSTLLIVDDYLRSNNMNAEIIVVSDGSSDNTGEVVDGFKSKIENLKLIEYTKNQGKGFAVKTGVEKSRGKYIVFADADNSTPIEELDNLYQQLKETDSDIAIGSRYLQSSNIKRKQPKYRVILGRAGNLHIRALLVDDIKDTQCGFKLFKHKTAKEIFNLQKVKRFGFDMEALVIGEKLGYKIVEVPVSWFNSSESRVRPVKDGLRTLKDLIYVKLNLWGGRYHKDDNYE